MVNNYISHSKYIMTIKSRGGDFNLIYFETDDEDELYLKMTELELNGKEIGGYYNVYQQFKPKSRKISL